MKTNTASRTAQYMALFRAIENERPSANRLFTDEYAIHFLDTGLKMAAKLSAVPLLGKVIPRMIHNKAMGALSSGTARTRYIDDLLQDTIRQGIRQVIILGAGFDTRALRLDCLKNIAVIEIDHPDTSGYKLQKLNEAGKLLPNVNYLQIDFNKESLDELASKHKINMEIPTTVIWEGVTNYLTAEAVAQTFHFIGRFAKGSFSIFTYIHQQVLDSPHSFEGMDKVLERLKENEELWTFGFKPDELGHYLQQFNLRLLEDYGAGDYRQKYMPERKALLNGYEFYRVAYAIKDKA
jgi:methyltransferase (TIGR00027 family)